jgi:hypothetical protein
MTISKLGALLPAALLCAFFATGLAGAETPVRLAVTDLEGLEQIQREFGGFVIAFPGTRASRSSFMRCRTVRPRWRP